MDCNSSSLLATCSAAAASISSRAETLVSPSEFFRKVFFVILFSSPEKTSKLSAKKSLKLKFKKCVLIYSASRWKLINFKNNKLCSVMKEFLHNISGIARFKILCFHKLTRVKWIQFWYRQHYNHFLQAPKCIKCFKIEEFRDWCSLIPFSFFSYSFLNVLCR